MAGAADGGAGGGATGGAVGAGAGGVGVGIGVATGVGGGGGRTTVAVCGSTLSNVTVFSPRPEPLAAAYAYGWLPTGRVRVIQYVTPAE
jgi:hypothetical protein